MYRKLLRRIDCKYLLRRKITRFAKEFCLNALLYRYMARGMCVCLSWWSNPKRAVIKTIEAPSINLIHYCMSDWVESINGVQKSLIVTLPTELEMFQMNLNGYLPCWMTVNDIYASQNESYNSQIVNRLTIYSPNETCRDKKVENERASEWERERGQRTRVKNSIRHRINELWCRSIEIALAWNY